MKCIVVTECAIKYNDKFLLIKRPQGEHAEGLLSFPGGKLEIADSCSADLDVLKNAIIREIFEEVGLKIIDPICYVTSSYFTDSKTGTAIIDIIFYCKLDKTLINVKPAKEEVPEYYWFSRDEAISKNNCPEWLIRYLKLV